MQQFKDLRNTIKKGRETLITAVSNKTSSIRTNRKTRKQEREEKQLYRDFKQQLGEIAHKST